MSTTSSNRNKKRPLVILLAAVLVIAAAVGAYAYWTSGGTGEGEAGTGTAADLVVVQTSDVVDMGPGVAAQDLEGNFDNDSDGPVYVGSVEAAVTGTDDAGCTAADYVITGSPMAVDAEVPVGNGVGDWAGADIAFLNDADVNQDACQGATVTITYTVVDSVPAP